MISVKGKWALLTGASRGIGRLTARFMAEQGCNLVLHSRKLSHLDEVLAEVRALGVEAHGVAAELNDAARWRPCWRRSISLACPSTSS